MVLRFGKHFVHLMFFVKLFGFLTVFRQVVWVFDKEAKVQNWFMRNLTISHSNFCLLNALSIEASTVWYLLVRQNCKNLRVGYSKFYENTCMRRTLRSNVLKVFQISIHEQALLSSLFFFLRFCRKQLFTLCDTSIWSLMLIYFWSWVEASLLFLFRDNFCYF